MDAAQTDLGPEEALRELFETGVLTSAELRTELADRLARKEDTTLRVTPDRWAFLTGLKRLRRRLRSAAAYDGG